MKCSNKNTFLKKYFYYIILSLYNFGSAYTVIFIFHNNIMDILGKKKCKFLNQFHLLFHFLNAAYHFQVTDLKRATCCLVPISISTTKPGAKC